MNVIAVTGARGWIGSAVCKAFLRTGHTVRRLVRRPVGPNDVYVDLCDTDWARNWSAALQGCGSIVHCAAHVHRPRETPAEQQRFHATNALGTQRLAEIARRVGIKRFVLASTMAVYDWSIDDGPRCEFAKVLPSTAYGRSKLYGEHAVRVYGGEWVIARLATVYGEGDIANFARLARGLRRKQFVLPGQGEAKKSIIMLTTAAEIIADLALRDDVQACVLNVAEPAAPTLAEICRTFSEVCGFTAPLRCPLPLLEGVALAGDVLQGIVGRSPLTSDTLKKLTTSTVVDCGALQKLFPTRLWASFEDSLRACRGYYAQL